MRRVFAAGALALLLLGTGLLGVGWLAVESDPMFERKVVLDPLSMGRAKDILERHRARVRPGMLAAATILPEDADVAVNYAVHRFTGGSATLQLLQGTARCRSSIPLAGGRLPGFLNIDVSLGETAGWPTLNSLQVGGLVVPRPVLRFAEPVFLRLLHSNAQFQYLLDSVRLVRFSPGALVVVYFWEGGVEGNVRSLALPDGEQQRIRRYHDILAEAVEAQPDRPAPLWVLLRQMFLEAAQDEDPVGGNRAAILVLAFLVLDKPVESVIPDAAAWKRLQRRTVNLDGREDFAKHFLVSAMLAAYADTVLSDAIGLYKEIEDSRGGSGFSFNDIAADRAGTRFGEKATRSRESARGLQDHFSGALTDRDLMPEWVDLPEFLPEEEFRKRFGGVGAPAYRAMMEEIERRVEALPLLR